MSLIKVKWIAIPASITLLIGQLGCASRLSQLPPPSEEVRAQLGTIGVISAHSGPQSEVETPVRGRAAGARRGALVGFAALFDPWAIMLGGAAPALIVWGAIKGANEAPPAAAVKKAETALRDALAAVKLQDALRDQVVQVARDRTHQPLVLLTENGSSAPSDRASYRWLSGQDIQTVLEISVVTAAMKKDISDSSCRDRLLCDAIKLVTSVQARLARVGDDTELYRRTFDYQGHTRGFFSWADNDAQQLREELADASRRLARQIVGELFCSGSTVSCSPVEPDSGSVAMGLEAPTGEIP